MYGLGITPGTVPFYRDGYAHIHNPLSGYTLEQIEKEVRAAALTPAQPTLNGVEQNFDMWTGPPQGIKMAFIERLAGELEQAFEMDAPGGTCWHPNEVSIQRYREGGTGIGPHRDARRFVGLVAVVNVCGNAVFSIYDEDRKTVRMGWRLEPGDVVLMVGYEEGNDRRPIHSVSGGRGGERISLTYRMMA